MGLVERLQGQEVVGSTSPLGLDTLRLMGLVIHQGSRWVLTPSPIKLPLEGCEAEDDESDDESGSESSLPPATELVGPSDRGACLPLRRSHI